MHVNRHLNRALIDTGTHYTLVTNRFVQHNKLCVSPIDAGNPANLYSCNGEPLNIIGRCDLPIRIQGLNFPKQALIIDSLSDDILLGTNFTSAYGVVLDF